MRATWSELKRGSSSRTDERRWAFGFGLAVIVLSTIPVLAAPARLNYDSGLYLAPPALTTGRLPLVPAVYWALAHNLTAITVFQAAFGAVCWSMLLWEVAQVPRRGQRLVVMVGVTAVACSTYVVKWDAAILSESLSISLLALLMAMLARWRRTERGLWAVVAVACAWSLTRSTNAYILVVVGLPYLAYTALRARRELPRAACLAVVGLAATLVSAQGDLWQQPFLHSMSERILPNAAFTGWFAAHGMPVNGSLRRLAGGYYTWTDTAYNHSPQLAAFRHWMAGSGKSTYLQFLLSHPLWVVKGTFGHHEELGPRLIGYYGGAVSRPWYPAVFRDVLLSHRQDSLVVLGVIDLGVIAAASLRRSLTRDMWLWLGVILLGLVTLCIDWAGDSWEIGRHSVEGTLAVALGGLLLLSCPIPARRPTTDAEGGTAPSSDSTTGQPLTPSSTSA